MGDTVLIEEFGHFVCHHVPVIRNRDEGDFFARLRFAIGGGGGQFR